MDLIIFLNNTYYLIPVTMEMVAGEIWKDCFDLCGILREKFTTYNEELNLYTLKDGSFFFGCICK